MKSWIIMRVMGILVCSLFFEEFFEGFVKKLNKCKRLNKD